MSCADPGQELWLFLAFKVLLGSKLVYISLAVLLA